MSINRRFGKLTEQPREATVVVNNGVVGVTEGYTCPFTHTRIGAEQGAMDLRRDTPTERDDTETIHYMSNPRHDAGAEQDAAETVHRMSNSRHDTVVTGRPINDESSLVHDRYAIIDVLGRAIELMFTEHYAGEDENSSSLSRNAINRYCERALTYEDSRPGYRIEEDPDKLCLEFGGSFPSDSDFQTGKDPTPAFSYKLKYLYNPSNSVEMSTGGYYKLASPEEYIHSLRWKDPGVVTKWTNPKNWNNRGETTYDHTITYKDEAGITVKIDKLRSTVEKCVQDIIGVVDGSYIELRGEDDTTTMVIIEERQKQDTMAGGETPNTNETATANKEDGLFRLEIKQSISNIINRPEGLKELFFGSRRIQMRTIVSMYMYAQDAIKFFLSHASLRNMDPSHIQGYEKKKGDDELRARRNLLSQNKVYYVPDKYEGIFKKFIKEHRSYKGSVGLHKSWPSYRKYTPMHISDKVLGKLRELYKNAFNGDEGEPRVKHISEIAHRNAFINPWQRPPPSFEQIVTREKYNYRGNGNRYNGIFAPAIDCFFVDIMILQEVLVVMEDLGISIQAFGFLNQKIAFALARHKFDNIHQGKMRCEIASRAACVILEDQHLQRLYSANPGWFETTDFNHRICHISEIKLYSDIRVYEPIPRDCKDYMQRATIECMREREDDKKISERYTLIHRAERRLEMNYVDRTREIEKISDCDTKIYFVAPYDEGGYPKRRIKKTHSMSDELDARIKVYARKMKNSKSPPRFYSLFYNSIPVQIHQPSEDRADTDIPTVPKRTPTGNTERINDAEYDNRYSQINRTQRYRIQEALSNKNRKSRRYKPEAAPEAAPEAWVDPDATTPEAGTGVHELRPRTPLPSEASRNSESTRSSATGGVGSLESVPLHPPARRGESASVSSSSALPRAPSEDPNTDDISESEDREHSSDAGGVGSLESVPLHPPARRGESASVSSSSAPPRAPSEDPNTDDISESEDREHSSDAAGMDILDAVTLTPPPRIKKSTGSSMKDKLLHAFGKSGAPNSDLHNSRAKSGQTASSDGGYYTANTHANTDANTDDTSESEEDSDSTHSAKEERTSFSSRKKQQETKFDTGSNELEKLQARIRIRRTKDELSGPLGVESEYCTCDAVLNTSEYCTCDTRDADVHTAEYCTCDADSSTSKHRTRNRRRDKKGI
jgi:phenylpyruvate tautomerase PptA (4-oxalocrotonate tautomerase family)